MAYALRKLPEAEAEAEAAATWYEEQRPGLGLDFLARVDEAINGIAQNPFRNGLRFGDVRRAAVRGFRFYGLYYFIQSQEVVVISVFNDRRHPDRLRERRRGIS